MLCVSFSQQCVWKRSADSSAAQDEPRIKTKAITAAQRPSVDLGPLFPVGRSYVGPSSSKAYSYGRVWGNHKSCFKKQTLPTKTLHSFPLNPVRRIPAELLCAFLPLHIHRLPWLLQCIRQNPHLCIDCHFVQILIPTHADKNILEGLSTWPWFFHEVTCCLSSCLQWNICAGSGSFWKRYQVVYRRHHPYTLDQWHILASVFSPRNFSWCVIQLTKIPTSQPMLIHTLIYWLFSFLFAMSAIASSTSSMKKSSWNVLFMAHQA